jgi:hypothetical protein
MKKLIIILLFYTIPTAFFAQIAINTDGAEADPSAIFDVKSTVTGILIPRMTTIQRDAINTPAKGLMVYVTDDSTFYYFAGTHWVSFSVVKRINDLEDAKSDNDTTDIGSSVFIGSGAGIVDDETDNKNVGVGYQALHNNTYGFANIAIGHDALYSCRFSVNNVAIGHSALYNGYDGYGNVAVGTCALYNNFLGFGCVAVGDSALYTNGQTPNLDPSSNRNTAVGSKALFKNLWGYDNTATGYKTLKQNYDGYCNTAFGIFALYKNDHGYCNTAVGRNTLLKNKGGFNNTALGNYAFFDGTDYHNSTALGNSTVIKASCQIRLGNSNVSSIGGYADWTKITDKRFTKDVNENVPGMALIRKLRPVTYHLDMEAVSRWEKMPEELRMPEDERQKAEEVQIGFIPQEVEKAAEELGFDFHAVDKPKNKDDRYGLRYAEFVPVLVKALQEQQKTIEHLSHRIEVLEDSAYKK